MSKTKTAAAPALRKTRAQHRAEKAANKVPANTYLPALAAERERYYAQRAARGVLLAAAPTPRERSTHYQTGDGETLQPTRPGSDQAAKLKSVGYLC